MKGGDGSAGGNDGGGEGGSDPGIEGGTGGLSESRQQPAQSQPNPLNSSHVNDSFSAAHDSLRHVRAQGCGGCSAQTVGEIRTPTRATTERTGRRRAARGLLSAWRPALPRCSTRRISSHRILRALMRAKIVESTTIVLSRSAEVSRGAAPA